MVLDFRKTLAEALLEIGAEGEGAYSFILSGGKNTEHFIEEYGSAKWSIAETLNQAYGTELKTKVDLYNWLHYNQTDEVSYFLNEAGSNALNYSSCSSGKQPLQFRLWMGKKGFIIAVEQPDGFNALQVDSKRIKTNQGAAFSFFRRCKSIVFFDQPEEAKKVFLTWKRE